VVAEGLPDSIVRMTRALADAGLRARYLVTVMHETPTPALARALDAVCARAEQAEEAAREALVAIVDAISDPSCADLVQRLREEAAGQSLLALERLVRHPTVGSPRAATLPADPNQDRIPDYGRGRPLTLGERKQLARRTDRDTITKLLRDPHPDVIRRVLGNPKMTEKDVLVLASKRPCRPDVLAEVARSARWAHRPRIRLALLLNPDMPPELAAPIVGLLMKQELRLVAESTHVSPAVRVLCLEHLERRPPGEFDEEDGRTVQ
jgi:hypothetical protein